MSGNTFLTLSKVNHRHLGFIGLFCPSSQSISVSQCRCYIVYCEECCIFSLATRHSATLPLSPPCRHPQHSECGDNDCNVTDKLTLCHHCPLRSAHYRYTIVGLQPSQRWTRNKLSGTPVRLDNCHCSWAGSELRSTHSLVKIVSDLEYFSSWHFNKWWSWSIYCSAHHSTRCRASYKCWVLHTAYSTARVLFCLP